MNNRTKGGHTKKWAAAAVLAFTVVTAVAGLKMHSGTPGAETEAQNSAETSEESGIAPEKTMISQEEAPDTENVFPLNAEEAKLFSDLYAAMSAKECSEAARILNDMEADWGKIISETLGGTVWLYRESVTKDGQVVPSMEVFSDTTEGTGLAVTRYNTAFYGNFSEGMPDGICFALQAMVLDEPRYTFAEGEWKDGKMNGEGRTGYRYYANAPKSGFIMTEKSGYYRDNLLEGPFTYMTESGGGETLTWKMEAKQGVIVLTDRWNYSAYQKEYTLPSEEDPQRSYVLSGEKVKNVMWNNLIQWAGPKE